MSYRHREQSADSEVNKTNQKRYMKPWLRVWFRHSSWI